MRMTITFKRDDDVIIYALEKIIDYARRNRYIFVAQSVCYEIKRKHLRPSAQVFPAKRKLLHVWKLLNIQSSVTNQIVYILIGSAKLGIR